MRRVGGSFSDFFNFHDLLEENGHMPDPSPFFLKNEMNLSLLADKLNYSAMKI